MARLVFMNIFAPWVKFNVKFLSFRQHLYLEHFTFIDCFQASLHSGTWNQGHDNKLLSRALLISLSYCSMPQISMSALAMYTTVTLQLHVQTLQVPTVVHVSILSLGTVKHACIRHQVTCVSKSYSMIYYISRTVHESGETGAYIHFLFSTITHIFY